MCEQLNWVNRGIFLPMTDLHDSAFYFPLCLWPAERKRETVQRGEMEEAESRMCPSFQDTDHMFPPTAPRWPLFLQEISLCTCVCVCVCVCVEVGIGW